MRLLAEKETGYFTVSYETVLTNKASNLLCFIHKMTHIAVRCSSKTDLTLDIYINTMYSIYKKGQGFIRAACVTLWHSAYTSKRVSLFRIRTCYVMGCWSQTRPQCVIIVRPFLYRKCPCGFPYSHCQNEWSQPPSLHFFSFFISASYKQSRL